MTTPEYKSSVIAAAEQATAHIRHAKQAIQHIHSREAALAQTKLDEAVQWLASMLIVEVSEKTLLFLAGSDVGDLDYLTGNIEEIPASLTGLANAPPGD